jgi:hypothetical protein
MRLTPGAVGVAPIEGENVELAPGVLTEAGENRVGRPTGQRQRFHRPPGAAAVGRRGDHGSQIGAAEDVAANQVAKCPSTVDIAADQCAGGSRRRDSTALIDGDRADQRWCPAVDQQIDRPPGAIGAEQHARASVIEGAEAGIVQTPGHDPGAATVGIEGEDRARHR